MPSTISTWSILEYLDPFRSGVFTVNFEQISNIVLVFPLLTLKCRLEYQPPAFKFILVISPKNVLTHTKLQQKECVSLTKWYQYFFSVSLKLGAYYITGMRGECIIKILLNAFMYFFGIFVVVFHHKICFYHFHFFFFFGWSIKFSQQNINQSETWINGL